MVEDAIILAGGRGTRMLPASLFSPKEFLPLVDTPGISHLIWVAAKANVKRIHIVLSEKKFHMFQKMLDSEPGEFDGMRTDLPPEALCIRIPGVEIIPRIQRDARGVGDALSVALGDIRGPFLALLGDMVILEDHQSPQFAGPRFGSSTSEKLVSAYKKNGLPCVGLHEVDRSELSQYGVVGVDGGKVVDIIEKPDPGEAPSNLILTGRYLFPDDTREILEMYPYELHGELQSIEVLKFLAKNRGLNAVNYEGISIYDSGSPLSWLKAQVDHAIRRDDTSEDFLRWIETVIQNLK